MTAPIVRANHGNAHDVAALIATAFGPLDVAAWLVPDPAERERVLYANFRLYVDHALAHGDVLITDDRAAVAVWYPRDVPLPDIADYDRRLSLTCGPQVDRFRVLDAAFDKHHPTEAHHHLAFLAVHPQRHGQGVGTALLAHYHTRLDRAGMPSYLEASSARSRALYARHGYADRGEPIDLPDGPRLWPMWRAPRPTAVTAR